MVSLAGVTGERDEVPPQLAELVRSVREASPAPAAVGFGIGTPEQAAEVGRIADGVIIGTRLVRAVADADGPETAATPSAAFSPTRESLEDRLESRLQDLPSSSTQRSGGSGREAEHSAGVLLAKRTSLGVI